jgi:hypothetical protein
MRFYPQQKNLNGIGANGKYHQQKNDANKLYYWPGKSLFRFHARRFSLLRAIHQKGAHLLTPRTRHWRALNKTLSARPLRGVLQRCLLI